MDTKRNVISLFNWLPYTLYLHLGSLQTTTILLSLFLLNLKSFPLIILYSLINVGLLILVKSNCTLLVTFVRGGGGGGALHYHHHYLMVTLANHYHPCMNYSHSLPSLPHFYVIHHFHLHHPPQHLQHHPHPHPHHFPHAHQCHPLLPLHLHHFQLSHQCLHNHKYYPHLTQDNLYYH
jgi:hypothetical protein